MDIFTILSLAGYLIPSGLAIWKAWQAHDTKKILDVVIEGVDRYATTPQMQPNQRVEETIKQVALTKGMEDKLKPHVTRVKKAL